MNLLEEPKQGGQLCPKCHKGILEVKNGKYGGFLGCTRYISHGCTFSSNVGVNLQKLATDLLKVKKKKTRRGKKKKPAWVLKRQKEKEKALKQYKQQSKERWEQYQEFLRKIHD